MVVGLWSPSTYIQGGRTRFDPLRNESHDQRSVYTAHFDPDSNPREQSSM